MRKTIATLIFLFIALSSGNLLAQGWLWARGNTGAGMDGWPVATDLSGNVFVGGLSWGPDPNVFGSFSIPFSAGTSSATHYQCLIAKYDRLGNVLWVNGTKNGDTYLMNIATDPLGNSFMFGTINSQTVQIGSLTLTNTVYPAAQYFIAKYDPAGNLIWAKNAGSALGSYTVAGGISIVLSTGAIATDAFSNVYITANFSLPSITIGAFTLNNSSPSVGSEDVFIVKYDAAGNVVWAKSVGGVGRETAYGITVTHSGDIYITGVFSSPSLTFGPSVINNAAPGGNAIAYIARYNSFGDPVWACASGGTGGEYAVGIASDINNNVYLTGGLKDNSINFSGTDIINPVPGSPVLYLVKFEPSNNVSWYKTIYTPEAGGADSGVTKSRGVWGYSIAMSNCGIVWVSGVLWDSVTIDGHILNIPVDSIDSVKSLDPIFVAGYTSGGVYAGSAALSSGGDDQNGIACDGLGNLYMCSDYITSRVFVAGHDTLPKGIGGEFLFVAKLPYLNVSSADFKHSFKTDCITSGDSITLSAPSGYSNYIWNDGHSTPVNKVSDTGVFWVYAFDSCTSSSADTFRVEGLCNCGKALFLPNSFTPNGDGQNDIFYPRSNFEVKKINSFRIFNRWGEMIFERENILPNDASNAWDGNFKSDAPRPDVYVWTIEALCESGSTIKKKGSVTIIR